MAADGSELRNQTRPSRAWALAIALAGTLALPASSQTGLADSTARAHGAILFGTVFERLDDPAALVAAKAPEEVRRRAITFSARVRAFRSRLPEGAPPGPESYLLEKRRHMEGDIVALSSAPGIEEAAADYAGQAELLYEWEGLSESPLGEAAFAERFLLDHSGTPLRPYLNLFLAHRFRCAFEILSRGRDPRARDAAAEKYWAYLKAALADPDPLVRFVAADLEKRPYLYLEGSRPARAKDGPEDSAAGSPCPETTIPGPIRDPRESALRCFGISAGAEAERLGSLDEFQADIDGDGKPELFIGSTVDRGNAGGTHFVFRQEGPVYRYLGSIFLHPKAFKVLAAEGNGTPRMLRYRRLGAGEGLLETVMYDGKAFILTRVEKVLPKGKDSSRLCELFGGFFCEEGAPPEATPGEPPIALRRAIDVAEAYVKEKGTRLVGQCLQSVVLRYDEMAKAPYWHVQWMWCKGGMGGELGLRVYLDGRVVPTPLGP